MLEAAGLFKRYANGTVAVDGVSFTAGAGVFGLLGPNGSWKTTLMSMLATITAPTGGTFRWQGEDAVRNPDLVRRILGYLPQDFGVYEKLTAREFVADTSGDSPTRWHPMPPRSAAPRRSLEQPVAPERSERRRGSYVWP